jgi:hypothetical protein
MAIWSQLPDEIIKNVCAYWCPRYEIQYRRIDNMMETYKKYKDYCHHTWYCYSEIKKTKNKLNGKDMLNKLMTLPFPNNIQTLREKQKYREDIPFPDINITEQLCDISHWQNYKKISYKKKTQFNFEKNPIEYSVWLEGELVFYFKDLYEHWVILFGEQHPKIYSFVEKDKGFELW